MAEAATYKSGEVAPQMAVLGLLSQGSSTVAALGHRLEKEFPHANYAPNTARTGLRRLAEKSETRLIREGEGPGDDLYEITELGLENFENWLYGASITPMPLRDPLHGKLAFVGPADIGGLIATVKALEEAAAHNFAGEHGKISALGLSRVQGDPRRELRRIRLAFAATLWGQEVKRLMALRAQLEAFQRNVQQRTGR